MNLHALRASVVNFVSIFKHHAIIFLFCFFAFSCNRSSQQQETQNTKQEAPLSPTPQFNADSAYSFVKAQCDFGPRVPNTKAHDACAEYLISKLKSYMSVVYVQKGIVTTFDKKNLNIQNIIASFNPESKTRVLLFAHWDTRPWADQDNFKTDQPIVGADDGGSGVGILLEIARQLSLNKPSIGIDIAFFDAEDWGAKNSSPENEDSYALGTQYWAKKPHVENYTASYGILLDMAGASNAKFFMEGISMQYAPAIVKKIWDHANRAGFSDYFIYAEGGYITDDHLYVNRIINIPSVDIINTTSEGRFAPHWHTHLDNMDVIDRKTLNAVGQTLLEVIFHETGA